MLWQVRYLRVSSAGCAVLVLSCSVQVFALRRTCSAHSLGAAGSDRDWFSSAAMTAPCMLSTCQPVRRCGPTPPRYVSCSGHCCRWQCTGYRWWNTGLCRCPASAVTVVALRSQDNVESSPVIGGKAWDTLFVGSDDNSLCVGSESHRCRRDAALSCLPAVEHHVIP